MNVIKDGIVIDVTEKAFEVIYKEQGYVPYNSDNVGVRKEEVEAEVEDLTKAEIMERLDEKEVEYDPKALKADLLEVLRSDD